MDMNTAPVASPAPAPAAPAPAPAPSVVPPGSIGLTADGQVILPGEPAGQPASPTAAPYTPEEVATLGIEKLDPARIPAELVPFYKSMQADYVRKTQQLAELRRSLEAPKPIEPVVQAPTAPEPALADRVYEATIARACELMGVTRENFDEFDPKHQVFITIAGQQLYAEAAQQQAAARETAARQESYNGLLQRYAQTEPHYQKINDYAEEWLSGLPFKTYQDVMRTLAQGSMEEIESKVIQEVRKAWYARHGTTTPTAPPVVETGRPISASATPAVIPTSFGNMSAEEQAQILLKAGFVTP